MTAGGPTQSRIADAEIQINEMVRILKKQRDVALAAEVSIGVTLAIAEARAVRAETRASRVEAELSAVVAAKAAATAEAVTSVGEED